METVPFKKMLDIVCDPTLCHFASLFEDFKKWKCDVTIIMDDGRKIVFSNVSDLCWFFYDQGKRDNEKAKGE